MDATSPPSRRGRASDPSEPKAQKLEGSILTRRLPHLLRRAHMYIASLEVGRPLFFLTP